MKIVSSGKALNSPGFYKKKQKKKHIQLALLSIGFVIFVSSILYLSRLERFLITGVSLTEENIVDREKIIQSIKDKLSGFYFFVVPHSNALLYPRRAIKQSLLKEFPRLKSITLVLEELHTLSVTVEERVPFALYCVSTSDLTDSSDCFLMDKEGFIFASALFFSEDVYFIYTTEDPITNPIGTKLIAVDEFQAVQSFIDNLPELGIEPSAFKIGDNEFSVFLPNEGEIIWRRDENLALVHSNLEAFVSHDSIKAQKNFFDRILRLDLRTKNKIFYRFR